MYRDAKHVVNALATTPGFDGYFPSPKSNPNGMSSIALANRTRRFAEATLLSACFQGDLTSLEILASVFDLVLFERYENFLVDKVVNAPLRKILYNRAEFPSTLKPLVALTHAFLASRVDENGVGFAIKMLREMGLGRYKDDQRYMARMLSEIFHNRNTRALGDFDKFAKMLSILGREGFVIDPAAVANPISKKELMEITKRPNGNRSNLVESEYHRADSKQNSRHGYFSGIVRAHLLGLESGIQEAMIPRMNIAYEWMQVYCGEYQERNISRLREFPKALDMESVYTHLDEGLSLDGPPKRLLFSSRDKKSFCSVSFLATIATRKSSLCEDERHELVTIMLKSGLKKRLSDERYRLLLINQLDMKNPGPSDMAVISKMMPHLKVDHDRLGISPTDMARLGIRGNLYARFHFEEKLSSDPEYIVNAFKGLNAIEQEEIIKVGIPGFSSRINIHAKDRSKKRAVLSDDLGI